MTTKEIAKENSWLAENGLPSLEEIWAKLNDHSPRVKMVKACDFFWPPQRFYEAMLKKFNKGGDE